MKWPQHIGLIAVGGADWMGGANYVRYLERAVRAAAPETRVSIVCGDALAADWSDALDRIDVLTYSTFLRRLRHRKLTLREALRRAGVDFVYPLTYDNKYNLGLHLPIGDQLGVTPWAAWIPDFQHRYLPEFFSLPEIRRRDTLNERLVIEAPVVVCSSQNAAGDFRRFYPEHAGKVDVLRFGSTAFEFRPDAGGLPALPEKFFLVCNQFWKHKNHAIVFEALRLLRTRGITPSVLCTGRIDDYRDQTYASSVQATLSNDPIGSQVRLLGLLPRSVQVELMRRAVAIIQPSLFEGWSTVVEDARALGRPTLLSDLAVHREQHPPGAHFFSPHDPSMLADLMTEVYARWEAGPDLRTEAAAREEAVDRLAEIGRKFLDIGARCCAMRPPARR